MPVTAADVRNVAFSKPPIGKRGYHEDEVDAFLDVVGAELARLSTENNDLRNQVAQVEQRQHGAPIDTGANLRPPQPPGPVITPIPPPRTEQTSPGGDHHVQAAKMLGLAQEIADRLTRDAKAEADAMLSTARTTSAQLLCQARAKADGMITEARTRAETLLTDARSRADTLDRQSREKAASLERDATRQEHPGEEDRRSARIRTRVPHPPGHLPRLTAPKARRARIHRIDRPDAHPAELRRFRVRHARRTRKPPP
jgi:DivIVA domain-containing protein